MDIFNESNDNISKFQIKNFEHTLISKVIYVKYYSVLIWKLYYLTEYLGEVNCERWRTTWARLHLCFIFKLRGIEIHKYIISIKHLTIWLKKMHEAFPGYWLNKAHVFCKLFQS